MSKHYHCSEPSCDYQYTSHPDHPDYCPPYCPDCNSTMVEAMDVEKQMDCECEQKDICDRAGRFSTCYKKGMKTCNAFIPVHEGDRKPLSDEDEIGLVVCTFHSICENSRGCLFKTSISGEGCTHYKHKVAMVANTPDEDNLKTLPIEDLETAEREMKPITDLKKLSGDHWLYIEELLRTHDVSDDKITLVEFHYKTAFEHGYKHAKEES